MRLPLPGLSLGAFLLIHIRLSCLLIEWLPGFGYRLAKSSFRRTFLRLLHLHLIVRHPARLIADLRSIRVACRIRPKRLRASRPCK